MRAFTMSDKMPPDAQAGFSIRSEFTSTRDLIILGCPEVALDEMGEADAEWYTHAYGTHGHFC